MDDIEDTFIDIVALIAAIAVFLALMGFDLSSYISAAADFLVGFVLIVLILSLLDTLS